MNIDFTAKQIPSLAKCIDVLGADYAKEVYTIMKTSEFRNASLLSEQITILQKEWKDFKVRRLIKLLGINNRLYYKVINNATSSSLDVKQPSYKFLLNPEDEVKIIQMIHDSQVEQCCCTGVEIRIYASMIYKEKVGVEREFTRSWFLDFKTRHANDIEKVKVACLDVLRSNISIDEVEQYFAEIDEMMKDPPHPLLFINFDESGFSRRRQKGKTKSVYIHKKCIVEPYWREETELHHISLVAAITAGCTYLRSLCLSPRKRLDDDILDTFFNSWSDVYFTPKGYMRTDSMLYWVKNILEPYVQWIRTLLEYNARCVIISDNCTSHTQDEVKKALDQIGNIKVIPLPAHSSHLTQMLDACAFGVLKNKYSSIPENKKFRSPFTRKLLRIKSAFSSSITQEVIRSSWEKTGFKINLEGGLVSSFSFKEDFKDFLRAQVLHQDLQQNE